MMKSIMKINNITYGSIGTILAFVFLPLIVFSWIVYYMGNTISNIIFSDVVVND